MVAVYSLPMRNKSSTKAKRTQSVTPRNKDKPPSANTRSSGRSIDVHHAPKGYTKRSKTNSIRKDKSGEVQTAADSAAVPSSKTNEVVEKTVTDGIDDMLMHLHVDASGNIRDFEYDLVHDYTEDIHEGLSKASGRLYSRYQSLWKAYCVKFHISKDNEYNEIHLLRFFNDLKQSYKPSTMWVIYSCINHYFRYQFEKNLKDLFKLQSFLKNFSSRYVSKKSKVFTPEQMHTILMVCQDAVEDTNLTLLGVGSALLYFGLLRSCDVLNITVSDVSLNINEDKYEIRFEHMRKRKNSGFTYTLPKIYTPLFKRYSSELKVDTKNESGGRFLRNFNKKSSLRTQNTGINTVRAWVKTSCDMLGISCKGYTAHVYRRSAATNLADAGVSFINLKRHGQWKSDSVVEGYIANSLPMRIEREQCLLPVGLRKPDSTDDSSVEKQIHLNGLGMWKYDKSTKSYVPVNGSSDKVLLSPNILMLSNKKSQEVPSSNESKECVPSLSANVLQEVRAANQCDRDFEDDVIDEDSFCSVGCETVSYPKFDYEAPMMVPQDGVKHTNQNKDRPNFLSLVQQVHSQPTLSPHIFDLHHDESMMEYSQINDVHKNAEKGVSNEHSRITPEVTNKRFKYTDLACSSVNNPGNTGLYSRTRSYVDTRNSVPTQISFAPATVNSPVCHNRRVNSGNTELTRIRSPFDILDNVIPDRSSRSSTGYGSRNVFHNCTFNF